MMNQTSRSHHQNSVLDNPGFNPTNVKIVCRIRPPKTYDPAKDYKKLASTSVSSPAPKQYTSVRNRSRSNSKDYNSPFRHQASVRHTAARDNSGRRSSSRSSQGRGAPLNKSGSFSLGCGQVQNDKKYCVFTTKERSNLVVATENAVPGKIINDSLNDVQDLKYFNNTMLSNSQSFTFNFDSVFNESHKQEKFYASVVRPAVRSFVEGENACIVLFGPSESGKTFTLKGKTGMDRGILPRAVEDMFNIVRNSEDRDEDYELLQQELNMSEDSYYNTPNNQVNYNFTQQVRDNYRSDAPVPERLFLKVSVYQIFVDKVLDLLTQTSSTRQRVTIDHYIDKESEEVVSKLTNITEKVVFTIEDFYSVLQEAFKNRRIESVSMQEQELRKKSHFIISLTLMKRAPNKKLSEVSHMNFVELSGSEQAVAEEKFYQDSSIRQFVTKSFNSLSSQLLKAALKKKTAVSTNMIDDGESKLINCLRNTLTSTSNAIVICCVNPGQTFFDHSLPALKFCGRIRDCIVRKIHKAGERRGPPSISSQQSDDIQYLETERQMVLPQITRDQIELIKKEFSERQQVIILGDYVDRFELDKWRIDRIEALDKIIYKLRQSGGERTMSVLIDDLYYLKDKIGKLSATNAGPISPRQDPLQGQTFNSTMRSQMGHSQRSSQQQPYYSSATNPYQVNSEYSAQPSMYDRQMQSIGNSHRANINIEENSEREHHYRVPEYRQQTEQSRLETAQTPNFDYQSYSSQYMPTKESTYKQSALTGREQSQILSPKSNQGYQSSMMNSQRTQRQNVVGSKQSAFQGGHFDGTVLEIETSIDDGKQMQSRNGHIQIYNTYEAEGYLSPKNDSSYKSSNNRQISSIQQTRPHLSQTAALKESQFLDRTHPQLEVSLTGRPNNISNQNSPSRNSPSSQRQQQSQNFRPNPNSRAAGKGTGKGDVSTSSRNPLMNNLQSQIRSKILTQNKSSLLNMSNKISMLQNESVYSNDQEALQDINRLIKLGDLEGVKLRVIQIYKEKNEQDKLLREIDSDIHKLRDEIETKDKLIGEYEFVIEKSQQEAEQREETIKREKHDMVSDFNSKIEEMTHELTQCQEKLKLQAEASEKLAKEKELLSIENQTYQRQKEEIEALMSKERETNEKLKQNYEILKEHEMNIIKDYEGKKSKEIAFYELTQTELHSQMKQEQARSKELEEQMFTMREDLRRIDFDYQKSVEDRKHMSEHIEKLEAKLEKQEAQRQEIIKQMEQTERECGRVEEEKYRIEQEHQKVLQQMDKLHLLIEEMEKSIQSEQQKRAEERFLREQKEREIDQLQGEVKSHEEKLTLKDKELGEANAREAELQKQVSVVGKMNEDIDKQLILMKAKEYDKVDLMRRVAELEAKIKYLQVDNEQLVKERNKLDIANVELNREKMEISQNAMELESELEYFRKQHEEHLDRFDQKFDAITTELTKLKNENIQLKEKEKQFRRNSREVEEERDEYREKCRVVERKYEEASSKLYELEREVRAMMQEREREMKDSALRTTFEVRQKEEEKTKMMDDIHGLIQQFKEEKRIGGKTHIPAIGSIQNSYY